MNRKTVCVCEKWWNLSNWCGSVLVQDNFFFVENLLMNAKFNQKEKVNQKINKSKKSKSKLTEKMSHKSNCWLEFNNF